MTQAKSKPRAKSIIDPKNYVLSNRNGRVWGRLRESFECPRCGGEGRLFTQNEKGVSFLAECDCSVLEKRLKLLNEAGIPAKFVSSNFETYHGVDKSQKTAKARALDFIADFKNPKQLGNQGLIFMGGPGLGKTHLAIAIIKTLILDMGVRCKFVDFFQLLSEIRHAYSQEQSELFLMNPYLQSRVLVIDELAKGRNNEWELTILDQFISTRYNAADKVTIFTTNFPDERQDGKRKKGVDNGSRVDTREKSFPDSFKQETLQERIGARIFSRIHEMSRFIRMEGDDFRHEIQVPR